MKYLATILLGFILFQADFRDGSKFILRMNDRTGQTWVLWSVDGKMLWSPIPQPEEQHQDVLRGIYPETLNPNYPGDVR